MLEHFGDFNYPVVCVWGRERERRAQMQNRHYSALPSPVLVTKLQQGALPRRMHSRLYLTTNMSKPSGVTHALMQKYCPCMCQELPDFISLWAKRAIFLTKSQHKKHPPRASSSPWLGSMCWAGLRSPAGVAQHSWQATYLALRLLTGVMQCFHSMT